MEFIDDKAASATLAPAPLVWTSEDNGCRHLAHAAGTLVGAVQFDYLKEGRWLYWASADAIRSHKPDGKCDTLDEAKAALEARVK